MAYFCRDKEAAKIIQERYNNDIEDRLSDGFNESDLKETPPEPPKEKLLLGEKARYLPYRLKSLNMEVSTTYQDLEDGKESVTLEHRTQIYTFFPISRKLCFSLSNGPNKDSLEEGSTNQSLCVQTPNLHQFLEQQAFTRF